jgi:hypothetical protein
MRPLSKQSASEAISKNIPTFIITKTKQVTILIKNQNWFIYRLILAIVCTMVKVHQSSIPPPWVGVTLKTQQTIEVGSKPANQTSKPADLILLHRISRTNNAAAIFLGSFPEASRKIFQEAGG